MLLSSLYDLKEWLHLSTFLTYAQEVLGTGKDKEHTTVSKYQRSKDIIFPLDTL